MVAMVAIDTISGVKYQNSLSVFLLSGAVPDPIMNPHLVSLYPHVLSFAQFMVHVTMLYDSTPQQLNTSQLL